jgi:muramoyltetrapeptide carboxypeptidase
MITPPYLKKGDTIAIVATARKISEEELRIATESFKSAGFQVELGNNIFKEYDQFAGTDEERLEDLQWALDDESVKAIVIARGGYGTIRLIDKINFSLFAENPKWIAGYSDVTALHSHIHSLCKVETLHALMPINFGINEEAEKTLLSALTGDLTGYDTGAHELNRKGKAEGILVGGNLSLLYALSGTPSDINTNGKILFLEDLDEYLYHIDRMMLNLKRSGKLANLNGLIVGGMTEMKDNKIPFGKTAEEIILEAVSEYDFPVCFNFPAGHIHRNLALYMGRTTQLNVTGENSHLRFI